ncbi:hypothetical protein ASPWEDRAFT_39522 [Aspergillus wentii DTO 134E9]|uniref:Uncharacterized protein n=1 Tax=Aspergillus wentii DTO 134E9 TaxID=1073089 RepID=A0A1L9RS76_ASPWE|nr:uncharacterized protein ASPWEDRAFT_39522 [Aspergillus wentii DTO 134E9]KAI9930619.1 hypothetical protein MW887_011373 [Aspergillus wentii]OJJ37780.1 hypothetical protein ASPWEDRAFT_39522 [Aspergillus wentii DTO 134E9]
MHILDFPLELLLHITDSLEREKDVLVFASLNRQLYDLLIDYLYRRNATSSGASALFWAAQHGQQGTAQRALDNGASLSMTTKNRVTPLLLASKVGQRQMVEYLLNLDGVDVNAADKFGQSSLTWAAKNGYAEIAKLLLTRPEIQLDMPDRARLHPGNSAGYTPLCYAAKNGHADVLQVLLETGRVDVHYRDRKSCFPLFHAAANGHDEVVERLLKVPGMKFNMDCGSCTPLMKAAEGGHEIVVQLLLAMDGIDIDAYDSQTETALAYAAVGGA